MDIRVSNNSIKIVLSPREVPKMPAVIRLPELADAVNRVLSYQLAMSVADVIKAMRYGSGDVSLIVPVRSVLELANQNQRVALPTEWRIHPDVLSLSNPFVCAVFLAPKDSWIQVLPHDRAFPEESESLECIATAVRCRAYRIRPTDAGAR